MRKLPTFRGYTVDMRLREFRKVYCDANGDPQGIDFIPFASEQGRALLKDYMSVERCSSSSDE